MSPALLQWNNQRVKKLDELFAAHSKMGGNRRGRRWNTKEINWALSLRLAGEFQGFARDLHSISCDVFARRTSSGDPNLENLIRGSLTLNRYLDKGNATPSGITQDFDRLGIKFWDLIEQDSGKTKRKKWNSELELLNTARNGIAHSDDAKISKLEAEGCRLDLAKVKSWRSNLDNLARASDRIVGDHLSYLFKIVDPWV
ncbi:hypothetical protein HUT17_00730 [Nocardiopsis flavescens]|nr:hypothetical protein HUT17_00730 [Nocardiopsis flavescens]